MLNAYLASLLADACQRLGATLPAGHQLTETPEHVAADLASNAALLLAKPLSRDPRAVASELQSLLEQSDLVDQVEIAGPGFLNITLSTAAYQKSLQALLEQEHVLAAVKLPEAERQTINVEFVSANPSGPLHIGNARGGPLGEAIVRLLEAQGHTVQRDFYVNDMGGQANRFAKSVLHFYAEVIGESYPLPEDGYRGEYVKELANEIATEQERALWGLPEEHRIDAMRQEAIGRMVAKINQTTDRMGVHFDRWYWQHELHPELVARALELLNEHDATMEKDGARWLKSGLRDDDRESVLVKSDGSTTYFLDDLAYHIDKLVNRGAQRAVVLLGADHHGHPPRMRAGFQAMGFRPEQYEAVVYQYVQLKEDGQVVGMAKREGKFVTADQVLDEVPRDVFTYFMLSKANETHVDFDLQLAKDTSEKNPVYSIQYAHARICSVIAKAGEEPRANQEGYVLQPAERALVRHLANLSTVVSEAARTYRVNLVTQYLIELAARYHQFYAQHRIVQAESMAAAAVRLQLSRLTQQSLAAGLELLHISAPESLARES